MHLHIQAQTGRVSVAVLDGSPALPTLRREEQSPLRPHGRGMLIVSTLATSWGAHRMRADAGKAVWFEIHDRRTQQEAG
jgi:hypothetical protein